MKCTFYRPATINISEFQNIVGKLSDDLHRLETKKYDEWSVYAYVYALTQHALPLKHNPKMRFLGLAEPESMPPDARVDFFYLPTYLATAFMMKATLIYPSLLNEGIFLDTGYGFTAEEFKRTLSSCMLACTGRAFSGAGALSPKECIRLFEDAGATEFVTWYPEICPEFNKLYLEKKAIVEGENY